ncbi:MAG: HK97 family phage prohead protease [Gemmatimonadetes bacterium]|nr:HK97 family phage prohead protease [Candidatus Palauibacter rhopaloidicola]
MLYGVRWRASGAVEATGRTLAGTVVQYGDVAETPEGPERFEAGAFGDVETVATALTLTHDHLTPHLVTTGAGLTLADDGEAFRFRAELPPGKLADGALDMVRSGALAGASMSYVPLREHMADGVRVVTRAMMPARGIALVHAPAFPASTVEARAAATANAAAFPAVMWTVTGPEVREPVEGRRERRRVFL